MSLNNNQIKKIVDINKQLNSGQDDLKSKKFLSGFTLVEFLIVISVVGILATLMLVFVNSARAKARDAKRFQDIRLMQDALERYNLDESGYPSSLTPGEPMVGPTSGITYMNAIPANPTPRDDGTCADQEYVYSQDGSGTSYHISFCIGENVGSLGAGNNIAQPNNIVVGPSDALPSDLVLSQTTNQKSFTVAWTGGYNNGGAGGCKLQFYNGSGWTDIDSATSLNCDADLTATSYDLNADGWKASWNATEVRVARVSNDGALGTFAQTLSCAVVAGSATVTPTIDEDCDGVWDDLNYTWTFVNTGNQKITRSCVTHQLNTASYSLAYCSAYCEGYGDTYMAYTSHSGGYCSCSVSNCNADDAWIWTNYSAVKTYK